MRRESGPAPKVSPICVNFALSSICCPVRGHVGVNVAAVDGLEQKIDLSDLSVVLRHIDHVNAHACYTCNELKVIQGRPSTVTIRNNVMESQAPTLGLRYRGKVQVHCKSRPIEKLSFVRIGCK